MKGSDIFPSRYVKSEDLKGKDILVTISHVELEKIGDDQKLILYFKHKDKGMVCNKTNFSRIAFLYGDETDDWEGKEIVLTSEFVEFQGKTVRGLRIRAPQKTTFMSKGKATVEPDKPESENPAAGIMDDEIPF